MLTNDTKMTKSMTNSTTGVRLFSMKKVLMIVRNRRKMFSMTNMIQEKFLTNYSVSYDADEDDDDLLVILRGNESCEDDEDAADDDHDYGKSCAGYLEAPENLVHQGPCCRWKCEDRDKQCRVKMMEDFKAEIV